MNTSRSRALLPDAPAAARVSALLLIIGLPVLSGCTPAPGPRVPGPQPAEADLPPIPRVDGPLEVEVVYPDEGATLGVRDSTFIFGSVGSGGAELAINGDPVTVEPNGAFLAFLPVPQDGVYRLVARTGAAADTLVRTVVLPGPPEPAPDSALIVAGSVWPRGAWAVDAGESVDIEFRGPAGGTGWLVLPGGERVRLEASTAGNGWADYRGSFAARPIETADTAVAWPALAAPRAGVDTARFARLVLALDGDTARLGLPVNMVILEGSRVGVVADTAAPEARGDSMVIARPGYGWGPYDYFFPNGTELVLTAQRPGQYRVRLADDLTVWSPADEIRVLPAGTTEPATRVENVTLRPAEGWIDIHFPVSRRVPFQVREGERSLVVELFGALSRTNRLNLTRLDPYIQYAEWNQPTTERYRLIVHLAGRPWGHTAFWAGNGNLVVRLRRPPAIDPSRPLNGITVAVDPSHGGEGQLTTPGAAGPTGFREAEAVLAVSRYLVDMLEDRGARVVVTRTTDEDVAYEHRIGLAMDNDAHLLLSLHMDAFPDGVRPWPNAGTHMFYFHPHSAELARHLQQELLDELDLPDKGVHRADFALPRVPWMPSVLTETMFMMIPRWEAALKDPDVQRRIAEAHVRGIEEFLRERAR